MLQRDLVDQRVGRVGQADVHEDLAHGIDQRRRGNQRQQPDDEPGRIGVARQQRRVDQLPDGVLRQQPELAPVAAQLPVHDKDTSASSRPICSTF